MMFTPEFSGIKKGKCTMATFLNPRGHKTPLGEFPTVSVDDGWPDRGLVARPGDQIGEAILAYQKKWSGHAAFPDSPWDARRGEIYLPDDLDKPRPASDAIPRYKLREFGALGPGVYAKGAEVDYPGWPRNPSLLEPMNESAKHVLSYMASTAGRPVPAMMPHSGGVLNLPSPGLDGVPQNFSHRASGLFGDAA
jgi:hypothetical protein